MSFIVGAVAMDDIEVFAIPEYIVLQRGNESLWCNRNNGTLSPQLGKR